MSRSAGIVRTTERTTDLQSNKEHGFTLIEIVIVIIVVGILAVVVGLIIQGPLRASVDTGRRAELVDLAEAALTRVTREVRLSVPNSVRIATVGSSVSLEVLRSLDGGRYRGAPSNTLTLPACGAVPSGDPLEFTCPDTVFDVLGQLPRLAQITTGGADCAATPVTADCVVVFKGIIYESYKQSGSGLDRVRYKWTLGQILREKGGDAHEN